MFCKNCGFKLEDGMSVCPSCGTTAENGDGQQNVKSNGQFEKSGGYSFDSTDNHGNETVNNSGNYYNHNNVNSNQCYNNPNFNVNNNFPNYGQYPNGNYYNPMQPNQPKKKNGGKIAAIIIICIVLVAGLGAGAYFLIFGNSQSNQQAESGANSKDDGYNDDFNQDYEDDPFYDNPFDDDDSFLNDDQTPYYDLSIYKGSIVGNSYQNRYFGIDYIMPIDYYALSESEIKNFYTNNNDDLSYGVIGLSVVDEIGNELTIFIQDIGISEYSTDYSYTKSMITSSVASLDDDEYVTSDIEYVTIEGVVFAKGVIELLEYDLTTQFRYTEFLTTEKDGVIMLLRLVYDEKYQEEELISHFVEGIELY